LKYLQRRRGFGLAAVESTGMDQIFANLPCHLADAAATEKLGTLLSLRLLEGRRQPRSTGERPADQGLVVPDLILLKGELGAGKTSLVRGLAAGLGIEEPITSPSFALAQHYTGTLPPTHRGGAQTPTALVHLDLYRLEEPASADELFLQEEEAAAALEAVMAVEWPERLSFVPGGAWCVELGFERDGRWVRVWQA